MSPFESTISDLPDPLALPYTMPFAHLTIADWFSTIVAEGCLTPRYCKVFREDLLYLFYGGVFYRPSHDGATRQPLRSPIAFVFHPDVLKRQRLDLPLQAGRLGLQAPAARASVLQSFAFHSANELTAEQAMVNRALDCAVNDFFRGPVAPSAGTTA